MLRYLKAVQMMKKTIEENNLKVMATIARYACAYEAIAKPDWWNKSKRQVIVTVASVFRLPLTPGPIVAVPVRLSNRELTFVIFPGTLEERWTSLASPPTRWSGMRMLENSAEW
jgi:hypothetical protein